MTVFGSPRPPRPPVPEEGLDLVAFALAQSIEFLYRNGSTGAAFEETYRAIARLRSTPPPSPAGPALWTCTQEEAEKFFQARTLVTKRLDAAQAAWERNEPGCVYELRLAIAGSLGHLMSPVPRATPPAGPDALTRYREALKEIAETEYLTASPLVMIAERALALPEPRDPSQAPHIEGEAK